MPEKTHMLVTQLTADKVKVNGPKVDGGYSVTFEVGEYMQKNVAELLRIPQQSEITIVVHSEEIHHA